MELMLRGGFKHAQVNRRILVPGESDVTNFTGLFRFEHRFQRSALSENPIRIFHANDFVELHQVHVISLQALQ